MSGEYDNTNSGALFKNDAKETERHPDYRGSLNVGGRDHWISAWLRTSKKGTKYMSLSVTAKDENRSPRPQSDEPPLYDDSDLPF